MAKYGSFCAGKIYAQTQRMPAADCTIQVVPQGVCRMSNRHSPSMGREGAGHGARREAREEGW